jgi:hypothetical protein
VSPTSTSVARCSLTTSLAVSSAPPACRRQFPATWLHRRGGASPVSFPLRRPPKWERRLTGYLPSLLTGMASRRRHSARARLPPLFSWWVVKPSPIWAGQIRPRVHSIVYSISIEFYSIQFKVLNFKIQWNVVWTLELDQKASVSHSKWCSLHDKNIKQINFIVIVR